MPEAVILVIALLAAGAFVLAPLWRPRSRVIAAGAEDSDELEAARLRHRVALETIRDLDADRRAGTLEVASYEREIVHAEARAAETGAALEAIAVRHSDPPRDDAAGRGMATVSAVVLAAALVIGSLVPGTGLASATVVNEQLAARQAAEAERQERIDDLLDALADDPRDTGALSELADAYLEGGSGDELVRAAVALRLLIELEPGRADAYERIITAYLRAGDYANASAALDAYRELDAPDPVEVAFFEGLVALRGRDDPGAAVAAFDRFLELAPDDPRAGMVRGLRDEASAAGD